MWRWIERAREGRTVQVFDGADKKKVASLRLTGDPERNDARYVTQFNIIQKK